MELCLLREPFNQRQQHSQEERVPLFFMSRLVEKDRRVRKFRL